MSLCTSCQNRSERPAPHAARTREYFDVLIKPLRHVAYRYGYALAQHGSLGFDIDLVACPWRDSCCDAESLAMALLETAKMIIGIAEIRDRDKDRLPEKKACGRLAWSFYLVPEGYDGPYIDLSVMPSVDTALESNMAGLQSAVLGLEQQLAEAKKRLQDSGADVSFITHFPG